MKIEYGSYIGFFKNKWRQRFVSVYNHPTDETKIISVGRPFFGGDVIECVENKEDWKSTIEKIKQATEEGRIYIYE